MSLAIFYDTETTGLPLWGKPSSDINQPHLVQLAAHLVDVDNRDIIQSIDLIVRPDGWDILPEASAIHGISQEMAMDVGIREDLVIDMFLDLQSGRPRIAHNQPFDARIIRIGIKRYFDDAVAEKWKAGEYECTMKMATPIVKCPPTERMIAKNMGGYKKASMQESYEHFFGEKFDGAHSAIADVNACMAVYFAIKDGEKL